MQATLPVHYPAFAHEWQLKLKDAETTKSISLVNTRRAYDRHAAALPDTAIGHRWAQVR